MATGQPDLGQFPTPVSGFTPGSKSCQVDAPHIAVLEIFSLFFFFFFWMMIDILSLPSVESMGGKASKTRFG